MALQQITGDDIAGWDSLQDIADSFEKRGLRPRPNLGEHDELVLQLGDDEFVALVNAGPGESATDFKPDNRSRHTNLVATNDFVEHAEAIEDEAEEVAETLVLNADEPAEAAKERANGYQTAESIELSSQ